MMDLATVDELLSTTRSVRRRLDVHRAVPERVLSACLRLAVQAPNAGNAQNWGWVVVRDPAQRARVAEVYTSAVREGYQTQLAISTDEAQRRLVTSALDLLSRLPAVPVLVVPCIQHWKVRGQAAPPSAMFGSIYPAIWSLQLALRSRGLGSTMLHVSDETRMRAVLDIPEDVVIAGLLPVAYYTGTGFAPAPRRPLAEVVHRDRWGAAGLTAE
jgi:nitroreductase